MTAKYTCDRLFSKENKRKQTKDTAFVLIMERMKTMKTMKKSITLFLTLGMAATFVACGSSGAGEKDQKYIGVAMPTQSGQRWNQDGQNMKTMLEEAG